jgi:hypothetical protein
VELLNWCIFSDFEIQWELSEELEVPEKNQKQKSLPFVVMYIIWRTGEPAKCAKQIKYVSFCSIFFSLKWARKHGWTIMFTIFNFNVQKHKRNVYAVHTPATVDYIMLCWTLVSFYLLIILNGEHLSNKTAIYVVKKVILDSQKEINIPV